MAANAQEEQQWLDGTHPALAGNEGSKNSKAAQLRARAGSDASSRSEASSSSSSPRFQAIDDDGDGPTGPPPLRGTTGGVGTGGHANNTGPKGVLADYEARGGGSGNTGPKGVLSDYRGSTQTAGTALPRHVAELISSTKTVLSLDDSEEDEDEDWQIGLDDDERAKERYRRQRLLEMKGSGERGAPSGRGKRLFGHLREIGIEQFLNAIDDEEPDVAVVLHLYEPVSTLKLGGRHTLIPGLLQDIEACAVLNRHLSTIARAYPRTKFIRALATEMEFSADSEEDTLPTVLVYRGGDLETTLIRPDLEWGRGSKDDVEALLRE